MTALSGWNIRFPHWVTIASDESQPWWQSIRDLRNVEPFKTVLSGNREAIAKLTTRDLEKIVDLTLTGMTTDEFDADVKKWLAAAKNRRWNRPYTELIYKPMIELMNYLRNNGYKTYVVAGGGQDFVRVFSERVYEYRPDK